MAPVAQANERLASAMNGLTPTGPIAPVTAAVDAARSAVIGAQASLAALRPGGDTRALAAQASAALTSEMAWLQAIGSAAAAGATADVSGLTALEIDARDKWVALATATGDAATGFPHSDHLVGFVHAAATASAAHQAAAATKAALGQFVDQVQSLLEQSASGRTQINDVYEQMQAAAAGGIPSITLAQAESTINAVIANRTSLAASARSLDAPSAAAKTVQAELVSALDASLTDDQQVANCLNQDNNGTEAIIFQGCLDASSSASAAADDAKSRFSSAYDGLRQQLGLGQVQESF